VGTRREAFHFEADFGEILGRHGLFAGDAHGSEKHRLELDFVARPGVLDEQAKGCGVDAERFASHARTFSRERR
jgi:hypothetical protein